MRLLFTAIISGFVNLISAQPVIITGADIPVPSGPFNNIEYTPVHPPAPPAGDSLSWDYSGYNGTVFVPNPFYTETDSFFTGSGIDVRQPVLKDLNTSAGYEVSYEYDFNANGVYKSGISVPYQAYDLFDVTGSSQDSLIFPAQKYMWPAQLTSMQFPFTAHSSWHSSVRSAVNFSLSVSSFGLNHEPGMHAWTIYRNDSISGWGRMRVYTASGPSIWYDVLMDKYEEYSVDSFYLSGSPASTPLLMAFSVSQGQKSNISYGYDFIRPGSFNYLVRVNYATDSSYSFVLGTYQDIDNILDTREPKPGQFSTLFYPNPANGEKIVVRVFGKIIDNGIFYLTDLAGREIQNGKIIFVNGTAEIDLSNVSNGEYSIRIISPVGSFGETITIRK